MNIHAVIGKAARWLVRWTLRLYYPHIEVEGRERLPANGAVLFVANHPNSLMDPALIGFAVKRPVHFFAKAPLFDVPVFGALMHALGMVPAYRGQDDKASVRKNLETLDVGAKYLIRGEPVGIFPEGKSHDREGLEQVRTGAARIASAALQGGAKFLIAPLGLNYERKERFRSAVWVRVGEPIDPAKFFQESGGEEKKAMRALTEEIDRRLKQVAVHLDEERWQPFLDELGVLLPPERGAANDAVAALRQRKRFADAMNQFLATDRPRAEAVAGAIEHYRSQLAVAGLPMDSPVLRFGRTRLAVRLLASALRFPVGFVPAAAGVLHHIVPFAITRGIVKLVKHPGRTTIAQNQLMVGPLIYAAWYAAVWLLIATHHAVWFAWLWTGLMPLAGIMTVNYVRRARRAAHGWWHELKMLMHPGLLRQLRAEQTALRQKLEQLREEYRAQTPQTPTSV